MSAPPNWAGTIPETPDGLPPGEIYILPDPPSIDVNPSIGISDSNEVPLPTKYRDLEVKNLKFENIDPPYPVGAEKWSEYPAIHDVIAQRDPSLNLRIYDISTFRDIHVANIYAEQEIIPAPNGGFIEADVMITAPTGTFADILGTSSLTITGGTTLDGGLLNGTSIGSLPVSGVNTVRLDVLPVGIDMVSPTFITIDAGGAANLAAGGALSLAGGSYIEYNTDQNYFINSSAGNDFTDILVGNIHPAFEGTDNLRINGGGSGRGVYLDDGVMVSSKIHKTPQYSYFKPSWDAGTLYAVDDEADYEGVNYIAQFVNLGFPPTSAIPVWDDTTPYVIGNIVQSFLVVFRCIADITGGGYPADEPTYWEVLGGLLDVNIWLANGEKRADNQVVFQPELADGYSWSLIKLKNSDGVRVMKQTIGLNAQEIGRLYDDTIYQPAIGSLPVLGDLNMAGYSVLNTLNVQPSQYDFTPEWSGSSTYYVDDFVLLPPNKKYKCLAQNLNLSPDAPNLLFWDSDGVSYVESDVVQLGGGTNYICILAYTTTSGDPAPDVDTTHWSPTVSGGVEAFWEAQADTLRGSLQFKPTATDTTYLSLIKPMGINTLAIIERNVDTNTLVNAGAVYDSTFNVPYIGGTSSIPVGGTLNMMDQDIINVGTLRTENIGGVATGSGLINVLDQLEGTGKSIQNFNYLKLLGPATGDNATLDLRTTADDIGLRLTVDADTGDATISAEIGQPLTITTDNKLYLNGDTGIQANTLSMTGDIEMGGNDINNCGNLETTSINTIANLFRRGCFASYVDQTFTAGSSAEQKIQFVETLGTTNGVSLDTTNFEIEVDADGSYKVDMSYQLTSNGGTHTHSYFWVKNNGTAIVGSTNQMTIRNSEIDALTFSRIFQLESGDKLTFWWNSDNSNDRLFNTAAITTPYVRPRQPSVVITVVSC